jgi:hypothetical protein
MREEWHIGFHKKFWKKGATRKSTYRWEDGIKVGVGEVYGKGMTGFMWLKIDTNGRWVVVEQLLLFERPSSME